MTDPVSSEERQTLLVALAHPDDEVGMVAAMQAQRARGDRVVLVWLTRGEMTEALGAGKGRKRSVSTPLGR